MMYQHYWMLDSWHAFPPFLVLAFLPLFLIFLLWTLFWKAWALWLSARRGEKCWFLVMLIINTAGILEIIYIFVVAKHTFSKLKNDFSGPHHHN